MGQIRIEDSMKSDDVVMRTHSWVMKESEVQESFIFIMMALIAGESQECSTCDKLKVHRWIRIHLSSYET